MTFMHSLSVASTTSGCQYGTSDTRCCFSLAYAVDDTTPMDEFPLFFEETRLNLAENMLCGDDDRIAVIEMTEQNLLNPRKYTWTELRQLVATYSSALQSLRLVRGDVVACTSLSEGIIDSSYRRSSKMMVNSLLSFSGGQQLCPVPGAGSS